MHAGHWLFVTQRMWITQQINTFIHSVSSASELLVCAESVWMQQVRDQFPLPTVNLITQPSPAYFQSFLLPHTAEIATNNTVEVAFSILTALQVVIGVCWGVCITGFFVLTFTCWCEKL